MRVRGVVAVRLDAMACRRRCRSAHCHRWRCRRRQCSTVSCLSSLCHQAIVYMFAWLLPSTFGLKLCCPARIARRRAGMRPTDGDPVRTAVQNPVEGQPVAGALALVLKLHDLRHVAMHFLPEVGDRQAEVEAILSADLHRPFIGHIVRRAVWRASSTAAAPGNSAAKARKSAQSRSGRRASAAVHGARSSVDRAVRADAVAAAVHLRVKLIGCREVQPARFELQVGAEGIVEAAVIAVQEQVAAARVVAAGSSPETPVA